MVRSGLTTAVMMMLAALTSEVHAQEAVKPGDAPPAEERVLFDYEADALNREWWGVAGATVASAEDPRAHGKRWLRMDVGEGDWPGVWHRLAEGIDYPAYRALRFSVFNPSDEPFKLSVSFWDAESRTYDTRFNHDDGLSVKPGANEFEVTWGALHIGTPGSRGVDVGRLRYFVLFVSRPAKPMTLYVDHVRLVPATPKGDGTLVLADFDGKAAGAWRASRAGALKELRRPDGIDGNALKVTFPAGQQYPGAEIVPADGDWLSYDLLCMDVLCPKDEATPRNLLFSVKGTDGGYVWLCTGLEKGLNRLRVPLELAGFASLGRVGELVVFTDYAAKEQSVWIDNVRLERVKRLRRGPPVQPGASGGAPLTVRYTDLDFQETNPAYGAVAWVPLDGGEVRAVHCTSPKPGPVVYAIGADAFRGMRAASPVEVWAWVRARNCWYWARRDVVPKGDAADTLDFNDLGRFGY